MGEKIGVPNLKDGHEILRKGSDFNKIVKHGCYYYAEDPDITNKPNSETIGALLVIRYVTAWTTILQICVTYPSVSIFIRAGWNGAVFWGPWGKIA